MFKRIFAFIIMIFFICFKYLTWVPSAAATGIPAFDAFYYAVLQSIGMAYTNGVEMDLAPIIADIRENVPDYLQQPDNALKYLLRNYVGAAWDNLIIQWNDSADEDVTTSELAAIRIASNEVSTPTLKDIVAQYQKKALDTDYQITTPINTKTIAFWNKYDSLYINNYLDDFVPDDLVIPDPPSDYVTLCNSIESDIVNDHSFFSYPLYIRTYGWPSGGSIENYRINFIFNDSSLFTTDYFSSNSVVNLTYSEHATLNVVTSGDSITLLVDGFVGDSLFYYEDNFYDNPTSIAYGNSTGGNLIFQDNKWSLGNYTPYTSNGINYTSSFNSLDDAITYIYQHFRNVDLFVDGTPWIFSNTFSGINVNVPNAVIDNSTDNGKIVSNPIYWTVDENTGTPIDSQINLDKLIDYLKGVIDGSNSDTSVDFGDLVDAGVIEKQNGTAISDENVIAVPVADVIDDSIADSDTIDTPIAAIEDLPPLPPLPPFFPTPNFPEGDPTSGFHGMSILARIINITNQSLPSEVVLVFYGVVFGAVILGLIKILHK